MKLVRTTQCFTPLQQMRALSLPKLHRAGHHLPNPVIHLYPTNWSSTGRGLWRRKQRVGGPSRSPPATAATGADLSRPSRHTNQPRRGPARRVRAEQREIRASKTPRPAGAGSAPIGWGSRLVRGSGAGPGHGVRGLFSSGPGGAAAEGPITGGAEREVRGRVELGWRS